MTFDVLQLQHVVRGTVLFLVVASVALLVLAMAVSPLGSQLYDLRTEATLLVRGRMAPHKVQRTYRTHTRWTESYQLYHGSKAGKGVSVGSGHAGSRQMLCLT
jgi:hypothetical protein